MSPKASNGVYTRGEIVKYRSRSCSFNIKKLEAIHLADATLRLSHFLLTCSPASLEDAQSPPLRYWKELAWACKMLVPFKLCLDPLI